MKALICDDDKQIIKQIKDYIEAYEKKEGCSLDISCYESAENVLKRKEKYDLAFIDIEMPGINGLKLTERLQKINPHIIILIVTSFQGYLDEAMDLNVFRFLSKPIDKNRFFRCMDSAMKLYRKSTHTIIANYYDESHSIFTGDILYLTIEHRKTKIVTKSSEYLVTQKLDSWEAQLNPSTCFAKPHYSYLVNLRYVTDLSKSEVVLSCDDNEIVIPVSRGYYTSFKKAFYEYMGESL